MSSQTIEQRPYARSSNFTSWYNNINDNDEIEIKENGFFYNTSLGLYMVNKKTGNNTIIFTRIIPLYDRFSFIYHKKNKIYIDSQNYDLYTYVKTKTPFNQWYDNIDETKIYTLDEISNWPFEIEKLCGNYQANKCDREFTSEYGSVEKMKYIHFHRRIAIGSVWYDDPDNHIYVNENGDENDDIVPYTNYNYTIKDKKIVEEEESRGQKLSDWF